MVICKKCGADRPLMGSGMCGACMKAIPRKPYKKRVKSEKPKKRALPAEKSELAGVLGSKRLSDTLDTLTGDDLPEKGEALSTETTVLLILVAAVILYFLFFQRRDEAVVNKSDESRFGDPLYLAV